MITDEEMESISPKSLKDPEVVDLYRRYPFMEAYARHTDLRVAKDGYKGAVGGAHDWERHGDLQLAFLKERIQRDDSILEVGCGTGRLARKLVPYLMPDRYYGVDISSAAIEAAGRMMAAEGIMGGFTLSTDWPEGYFDKVWAFSVIVHLPLDEVVRLFARVRELMHYQSKFWFSYVAEAKEERTGLKQFRHTAVNVWDACLRSGLLCRDATGWTGEQRIAVASKA